MRFARAVLNRPYKFTIILLVANLFVFMLMWQSSGMTSECFVGLSRAECCWPYGAKLNYLIHEQHQWWRFVTPMFLHVNLPHLMVNMYSLWIVGPYVEKLYGSAKFVVFWVVTGVAGVVASYLTVQTRTRRSARLDGFFSKLLMFLRPELRARCSDWLESFCFWHQVSPRVAGRFQTRVWHRPAADDCVQPVHRLLLVAASSTMPRTSVVWFQERLLALVVDYRRPGERSGIAVTWRVLQIAAIALVAVSFR